MMTMHQEEIEEETEEAVVELMLEEDHKSKS